MLKLSSPLKNKVYTLSAYSISDYSMEKNKPDRQSVPFTPDILQKEIKRRYFER